MTYAERRAREFYPNHPDGQRCAAIEALIRCVIEDCAREAEAPGELHAGECCRHVHAARIRALATLATAPVMAPKCECDKHETACARTADYLITRAGKRIAVCDRCTFTDDDPDDRDLTPDWSTCRPTPEAPR